MGVAGAAAGVPTGIRFMRTDVRQGLVDLLEGCDKVKFGRMVRCASGVHIGKGFCEAKARAAVDCKVTDWDSGLDIGIRQGLGRRRSWGHSRRSVCRSHH